MVEHRERVRKSSDKCGSLRHWSAASPSLPNSCQAGVWALLRLTREAAYTQSGRRLYSEATAFLVSHILVDRDSRSVTFGLENPLATCFWSAVKTGTNKEMRDNGCIGYTRQYTVGVWLGNLSGEPMRDVSSVTGAASIWGKIMAWLHRTIPSPPLEPPIGVLEQQVTIPDNGEPARNEWFLQGTQLSSEETCARATHLGSGRSPTTPLDTVSFEVRPGFTRVDTTPSQKH